MKRCKLHEVANHAAELSKLFPTIVVKVAEIRLLGTPRVIGYAPFITQVPEVSEDGQHKYTEIGRFRCGVVEA